MSQHHDGDGKEHLVSGNRCHSGDFQVLCVSANVSTYSLKTTIKTGAQWDCCFGCSFPSRRGKWCQTCWMDSRTNCLVCSLGNNVGNVTSRLNHVNRNEYSESQQPCSKTVFTTESLNVQFYSNLKAKLRKKLQTRLWRGETSCPWAEPPHRVWTLWPNTHQEALSTMTQVLWPAILGSC